jgi:hypothetical protein
VANSKYVQGEEYGELDLLFTEHFGDQHLPMPREELRGLVDTYAFLFNNPECSDLAFKFINPRYSEPPKVLYACKSLLCKRSAYFNTSKC